MKQVIMPRLGLNMEAGTVTKWNVKAGDVVKKGDELCEIESEKTINVVESEFDGIVERLVAEEGEEVAVLDVIAEIKESGE